MLSSPAVRPRIARLSLAVYLFIWFGLIVPGHRKGVVTLPGTESCCCDCCQPASGPQGPSDAPIPPSRAAHCAICDFAAHLTLPPPVDFSLAPLGLAERVIDPTVKDLIARLVLNPFDGRGPPLA
jgi:hypothetical protein